MRGKGVPLAVRQALLGAWEEGAKEGRRVNKVELARRFNLTKSTVLGLIKRYRQTGMVAPAPRTGRTKTLSVRERGTLATLAEKNPGKSLRWLAKEIGEVTGKTISDKSVRRYLKITKSDLDPVGEGEGIQNVAVDAKKKDPVDLQEELEEDYGDESQDFEEDGVTSGPVSPVGLEGEQMWGELGEVEKCSLCSSLLAEDKFVTEDAGKQGEDSAQFTWRRLLEIPEGRWREARFGGGRMRLCSQCEGEVETGRYLYRQLEEAAGQFRRIQKRLIARILASGGDDKTWRQFVRNHNYRFNGPFVIGGEDGEAILEEPAVVVKREVDVESDEGNEEEEDYLGGDLGSPEVEGSSGNEEDFDMEEEGRVELKTENSGGDQEDEDWTPPVPSSDDGTDGLRRSGRKRKLVSSFDQSEVKRYPVAKKSLEATGVGASSQNRKKGWSSCEICDESVKSCNISEHVRNHVGEELMAKCPNASCPLVFTNIFARRRHLLQNACRIQPGTLRCVLKGIGESENAYLCQECGAACRDMDNLKNHLNQNHQGAFKNLKCPVTGCQEMLGCRQSVQVHLLEKHDVVKRALALQNCAICSEHLWVEDMDSHLKTTHDAVEMIRCSHCPHLFPTREYLLEHLYQAHRQSTLSCDICSSTGNEHVETFQNHIYLREHYFKEHQVGSKFPCHLCPDKIFWKESFLEHHLKKVHQNRQRLTCDICELAAGQTGTPAPSFPNALRLQGHKIREHGLKLKPDRPFLCDTCGDGFGSRKMLENHKRIHTGERPFICPQCGQQFRQSEVLGRHLKGHAEKGDNFKAKGPMKHIRKRVTPKE